MTDKNRRVFFPPFLTSEEPFLTSEEVRLKVLFPLHCPHRFVDIGHDGLLASLEGGLQEIAGTFNLCKHCGVKQEAIINRELGRN